MTMPLLKSWLKAVLFAKMLILAIINLWCGGNGNDNGQNTIICRFYYNYSFNLLMASLDYKVKAELNSKLGSTE